MKKIHLLLLLISYVLVSASVPAQSWEIGNTPITFTDPNRNNRTIPTEIFYPANTSGTDVPPADGEFPVIAFGHGFIMVYSAYQYLWEALVPEGYIMAFPTTEGSAIPAPDHLEFGLDLKFLVDKIKSEGQNPASPFYGHVADSSAIMGHSMGGGASFLAVENTTDISAMITFAAAETNPSAIAAAQQVTIPTLVFSGSDDCVTPPDQHQVPMYNNLGADCKTFISITGGGHCYFANYNFNCSLGELFCNPAASITRQEQHSIVLAHLIPYLDFMLKGNISSWESFNNLLNNPNDITLQQTCNIGFYDVKVLLEGPNENTLMTNFLNISGSLPLIQPYSINPWNYNGPEAVTAIPNTAVVDWILLEFRDAPDAASAVPSTIIGHKAAFILQDGRVADINGVNPVRFDAGYQDLPFVVIYHRNHLAVMTANSPVETDGIYNYDFTVSADRAYGTDAQKLLPYGSYGLFAGDFNADGTINSDDRSLDWMGNAGTGGYLQTDGNLDGQTDHPDKNDAWLSNLGKSSQVPE